MHHLQRASFAAAVAASRYSTSAFRIGGNQRVLRDLLRSPRRDSLGSGSAMLGGGVRFGVLRSEFSTLWPLYEKVETSGANGNNSGEGAEASSSSGTEGEKERKEEGQEEEQKKKEPPPPPPPHGDKSPLTVFYETLQSEFKKSQEWQESTKQLASSAQQFTESPAVKKAREAYGTTAQVAEKVGGKAAETLGKTASAVGKGAVWTWETPVVKVGRAAVRKTGEGVATITKPVRETKVYKDVVGNVKEVIDDGSSSRYGGYLEREERKRQRLLRESKGGAKIEKHEENQNAGTNVTLHKDAAWKESWRTFRDSNKLMQSLFTMRKSYEESDNPVISATRSIADRFAGFFAENETALVIRKFREMDPNFQVEPFLRELREYILPEVLDAYCKGDTDVLKAWLSAAQYNVYAALNQQYTTNGLKLDGKVLDIRNVDILSARILEPGEIPVFIITCRTQEVHVYRDLKTDELKAGMEDKVQQVTYAIGITRLPDEVANPETNGWRLIELQKSARDFI
ncbi:hypothetical protein HOY80DRAFT_1007744 [Tuber brumale]|nr:hypothetical protein HOY80DRAFT_1007744 [Tuber brumale]